MGMTFSVSGTEWTIKGESGSHSYQVVIDNSANNRGNFKSFKIPYDGSDLVGTGLFGTIRFYASAGNYNMPEIPSANFERQLKESNSVRVVIQTNYDMDDWAGAADPYKALEVIMLWYFYPDRICLELVRYASGNSNNLETNLCFELQAPGGSDKEYVVNGGSWTNFPTSFTDVVMTSRLGIRSNGSSSSWCLGFMQHKTTEYQDIFAAGDYPRLRFDDPAQQIRWQRDADPDGSKRFRLVLIPYVGSDIITTLDEYYNDYNFNSARPHTPTFSVGAGEAYNHQENYVVHGDNDGDDFDEGETTEQIVASSNDVDFTVDGSTYKIKKLAMQIHQMYLRTGTVGSPVTRTIGYWKCQDEAANTTVLATVGSNATLSPDNTQDHDDDSGFRRADASAGNGALYLSSSNAIILPANGCPTANGSIMFNARMRYAIARNSVKYYIISTYKPGADSSVVEFLQEASGTYWTFNITDSAGTSHYKRYNTSNLANYLPYYTDDTAMDTDLWSRLLFTWNSSTPSMDLWIDGRKVTADAESVGAAWNSNNLNWTNNRIQLSRTTAYAFPFRISEITTLDGCLDLTNLYSPTIDGSAILVPQIKLGGSVKVAGTDYNRSFIGSSTWVLQLLSDITTDDYQIEVNDTFEIPTLANYRVQSLKSNESFLGSRSFNRGCALC